MWCLVTLHLRQPHGSSHNWGNSPWISPPTEWTGWWLSPWANLDPESRSFQVSNQRIQQLLVDSGRSCPKATNSSLHFNPSPSRFQPWAHMWRPPCKSSHCYHSELPKSTDFCPVPASGSSGHHEMCVVNPSTINPKQMPWAILSSPHDRAKCIAFSTHILKNLWKLKK